jgi:hypothetical protein
MSRPSLATTATYLFSTMHTWEAAQIVATTSSITGEVPSRHRDFARRPPDGYARAAFLVKVMMQLRDTLGASVNLIVHKDDQTYVPKSSPCNAAYIVSALASFTLLVRSAVCASLGRRWQ